MTVIKYDCTIIKHLDGNLIISESKFFQFDYANMNRNTNKDHNP